MRDRDEAGGEVGCIVGPFSSESIAVRFAGYETGFASYQSHRIRVFAQRDSWYVEVCAKALEPVAVEV